MSWSKSRRLDQVGLHFDQDNLFRWYGSQQRLPLGACSPLTAQNAHIPWSAFFRAEFLGVLAHLHQGWRMSHPAGARTQPLACHALGADRLADIRFVIPLRGAVTSPRGPTARRHKTFNLPSTARGGLQDGEFGKRASWAPSRSARHRSNYFDMQVEWGTLR